MDILEQTYPALRMLLPALAVLAAICAGLWAVHWLLLRRKLDLGEESRFPRQILMFFLSALALVVVLLLLPFSDNTRNQLFALLGLLLTAVIALSSTTFVANAMAGMMLRAVRSFRPGDFIRVGEHFGRVTERGLFHTEIQTEDRDLTTIPNLYLVSHPVSVLPASRTLVSASVALGYNNQYGGVETLLTEAAEAAGLQDSFVQVVELGDFSVNYRVAGFLPEVKQLLTARSNLRKKMLDTLHGAGIEIVSPTFMNQRSLPVGTVTRPSRSSPHAAGDQIPEELIFDKAEEVEKVELLRKERENISFKIKELEALAKESVEETKVELEEKINFLRSRSEVLKKTIEDAENKDS